MANKSKPLALEEIRDSAREMLASGEVDEALDYLLSALDSVLEKNRSLELLLAKLRRQQVGKKSERIDPRQLSLLFEELARQSDLETENSVDPEVETKADAELASQIEAARKDELAAPESKKRKKNKREVKTRNVERIEHHRTVPEDQRLCESCGKAKRRMGTDTSKVLEYVPGHFVEHSYHLEKYACGSCKDGVTTAEGPAKVLERSVAGSSLLAHIVVSKFADHCPLHRQRRIFRRDGTLLAGSPVSPIACSPSSTDSRSGSSPLMWSGPMRPA